MNGNGFKLVQVGLDGDGNVVINADTEDMSYMGNVTVEQTGNEEGYLYVGGKATVKVTGDVGKGIGAEGESNTTVTGDVTGEYEGVYAQDKAEVTVNGDITGEYAGVAATGEAQVTVDGDVTSEYDGVYAQDEAAVTVNGDVTGGEAGVAAQGEAQVTVNGDVTSEYDGVYAQDEAQVTVNGDVTGGDGIVAKDTATVTVNGDVTGNAPSEEPTVTIFMAPQPSKVPAGNGVVMDNTATVKVTGNVKGGNNTTAKKNAGHGVRIWVLPLQEGQTVGSLTVEGSVIGGVNTGEGGKDGNSIYYDVAFVLPTVDDATTPEELDGKVLEGYYSLMNFAQYSGVIKPEMESKIDALKTTLNTELSEVLGETFDFSQESLPSDLDEEILEALKPIFTQFMKDVYAVVFPAGLVYDIPEITVSKLQAVNDAFFGGGSITNSMPTRRVQTEKVMDGQALADLLGAEVKYLITVPTVANGKVTADKATAKAGETVKFTVTPEAGYEVGSFTANGKALTKAADGTYSYVMEAGGAEVALAFAKIGKTDVDDKEEPENPDDKEDGKDTAITGNVPKTGETHSWATVVGAIALLAASVCVVGNKKRAANK